MVATRTEAIQGCCGLIDPGMGDEDAATVAELFKALSDPTRVRIMNLLIRNPQLCVCDVQENFDLSQGTISHHLGVLAKAGLIDREVSGRWSFYRANREALAGLSTVLEVR
jgi:ArsR family transcriptional regulator, arsenate/arsenite/antimonite-responsive transcriptional repressor